MAIQPEIRVGNYVRYSYFWLSAGTRNIGKVVSAGNCMAVRTRHGFIERPNFYDLTGRPNVARLTPAEELAFLASLSDKEREYLDG